MTNSVQLQLEKFSGPLDLLLCLIKDQKLNISELALSRVTEQYLNYLDTLEKNRANELADFLVIGTKLIFLKSRALLPQFSPEEDDEPSLEEQLRLYKSFLEASKIINKYWQHQNRSVFRSEPPRKSEKFTPPKNLDRFGLHKSMIQLVDRLKPVKPLPETSIDKAISMKEKIDWIRKFLTKSKKMSFQEVMGNTKNKTDIIVSFLALLELVKQKTVSLKQDDVYSDILIVKV